ncbi:hypothetical protein SAMN04487948_14017 [Halogranum amylolyticum]|uniref:Uncharacterized protein n=1 Tax=Halogranum amylolyticum TaxID=660520 RepID=A0A1H8WSR4_9EURY|nr:hypothetical protein [Halogranum amylolyticum]SEP30646.1 hypothetical protein SAMN04487948_14017 [Halogranum amylolyticum]
MSTPTSGVHVNHRPARLSGTAAVLLGVVALAAVAVLGELDSSEIVWATLFVEGVGIGLLALGRGLRTDGKRTLGLTLTAGGLLVVLVAFGLAVTEPRQMGVKLWLLVGTVAAFLVAVAVVPVVDRRSRQLLKVGSVLLFFSVLLGGLVALGPLSTLLVGAVAALLVWDLGENAVAVGEQLGRNAPTRRLELTHLAASLLVGGVAVIAGLLVSDVGTTELSFPSFVVLVVAVVLFGVALRN